MSSQRVEKWQMREQESKRESAQERMRQHCMPAPKFSPRYRNPILT